MHSSVHSAGQSAGMRRASSCSSARPLRLPPIAAVRSKTSKMVVCSKTITAKPGEGDKVASVLQEMLAYTEERASVKENGIVSLTYVKDQYEENVFHCYERYTNNGAMGKHNSDPAFQKIMQEKLLPHLESPMGWIVYEWKDGKLGAASVAEGPKGEGGLDDATGANGGSGGASMKQTSRAMPVIGGMPSYEEELDEAEPIKAVKNVVAAAKNNIMSFFQKGFSSKNEGKEGKSN